MIPLNSTWSVSHPPFPQLVNWTLHPLHFSKRPSSNTFITWTVLASSLPSSIASKCTLHSPLPLLVIGYCSLPVPSLLKLIKSPCLLYLPHKFSSLLSGNYPVPIPPLTHLIRGDHHVRGRLILAWEPFAWGVIFR